MRKRDSASIFDGLLAATAGLLALALYFRTLAPGLLGGDSGEFQFAAWLGGFAHPTGYPLYLLGGWLWTHLLPAGDPAWRMNAFSALWGGVAVGLVYLLALKTFEVSETSKVSRNVRRSLALCAALTFAVSPTFWSQAVIAEVYTLNAALIAAIFLAVLAWGERPTLRRACLLAALYGLGLAHHRAVLLLAPALAVYLWLAWRTARTTHYALRTTHRALLPPLLCLLLPLLLYAYIPLCAPHTPYFRLELGTGQILALYEPTLGGFLTHISGSVFGSALGATGNLAPRLAATAARFVGELTWPGIALGLVGLLWLVAGASDQESGTRNQESAVSGPLTAVHGPRSSVSRQRSSVAALTLLSFLVIVAFNLFYAIGDIHVFYIPAYLIWVLWIAAGIHTLATLAARLTQYAIRNTQYAVRLVSLFPCLLVFLLPAWLLVTHFDAIDQSRNTETRTAWQTILAQPIPQDAILVGNDRDELTPQWYLKYVEGMRPDLDGLFPLIVPGAAWADVGQIAARALETGRPVYLIKPMPGLAVKFRLEPAGMLVRVLGPAAAQPPDRPADAIYAGAIRLTGYDLRPASLTPGGAVSLTLRWQPLRLLDADYTTFVQLLNADGAKIGQSDHRPGGVYYPTSLWKPGETLADTHTLSLPADLGRPPYTILAGLYTGTSDLRQLGQPQTIGEIGR